MARQIPEHRIDELVRAATEVFIARGYRLTQMSDVAEAVGVAKGTLYGYVESKDALLWLCLVHADETGRIPIPESLPVERLAEGALSQAVKAELARQVNQPALERALRGSAPADAVEEARAVVGEIFDLMYRHRHGIKLLDRCLDHPELGHLWQSQGREETRLAMARYIESRIESGHFRPVPNLRLAARIVIEGCATWAVHIHWDRSPEPFDPAEARDAVIESLVRGLLL